MFSQFPAWLSSTAVRALAGTMLDVLQGQTCKAVLRSKTCIRNWHHAWLVSRGLHREVPSHWQGTRMLSRLLCFSGSMQTGAETI